MRFLIGFTVMHKQPTHPRNHESSRGRISMHYEPHNQNHQSHFTAEPRSGNQNSKNMNSDWNSQGTFGLDILNSFSLSKLVMTLVTVQQFQRYLQWQQYQTMLFEKTQSERKTFCGVSTPQPVYTLTSPVTRGKRNTFGS